MLDNDSMTLNADLLDVADDRRGVRDAPESDLWSAGLRHGGRGHVLDTPHCVL